jgi:DNA-binding CsgD family transcriptional regulator/ribosome modulation factor
MKGLSATNKELLELIELLYDAALDPAKMPIFLERVARGASASRAALFLRNPKQQKSLIASTFGCTEETLCIYNEHYWRTDIWMQRAAERPVQAGWAGTSQDICPLSELQQSEFYNDFLKAIPIEHAMWAMPNGTGLAHLGLSRGRDQKPFEQEDLSLLRMLMPHLRRAFRLHSMFAAPTHTFGLTPAEARVALALKDGKSTPEIMQSLKIGGNTLKFHMAHIFEKTGTSRQSELMRLLILGPREP